MRCLILLVLTLMTFAASAYADTNSLPVFQPVCFQQNSLALNAKARAKLDRVAAVLVLRPELSVLLTGHTDGRSSEEFALVLGERMAIVVKQYLVQAGVPQASIATQSRGKSEPVSPAADKRGRDRNRRVEIVVQCAEHPGTRY